MNLICSSHQVPGDVPVQQDQYEERDEEEHDDDEYEVSLRERVLDRGEADGRLGVLLVRHHGHHGGGQEEGQQPRHHAPQASLALRPNHAGLGKRNTSHSKIKIFLFELISLN